MIHFDFCLLFVFFNFEVTVTHYVVSHLKAEIYQLAPRTPRKDSCARVK